MDEIEDPDDHSKSEKKKEKRKITVERLRLATERLQLASVRTTLTLIALGFGVYKVFYSRIEAGLQPVLNFPNGRDIGMFLIFIGFGFLLLSTLQHVRNVAKVKLLYEEMPYSVSLILSYFILALSLLLFFTVIFRL